MAGDQIGTPEAAGSRLLPGGFSMPETLRKRSQFLAAARGHREARSGFVLQGIARTPADHAPARVGYTCSKKVGNAVARNRAKRRLRAAAFEVLGRAGRPGWDYVLIGRKDRTAELVFDKLLADLGGALEALHRKQSG